MKNKILLIIITVSLVCFIPAKSQTGSKPRDKFTLLTMPYNKRPLTLYRGQFQANAGYKFAVRSHSFDNNGDVIDLKENGNSSVLHYYYLDLKYGLFNFIELGAEVDYLKRGIRKESITYMESTGDITFNELSEYKGMGDLFLYTSLRLPFEYKWFDFRLSGGMFIPTAKFEPEEPTHTITDMIDLYNYTINYHFNNRNGFGVPLYRISAEAKISFSKFTFETGFNFRDPLKEGTNIRWDQTLANGSFSYTNRPYQYLPDRTIMFNASIHYQAAGWFNIYLNGSYLGTSGGWTDFWDLKYSNPEIHLLTIEPGYELQISPSLTLYQIAGISLFGKNSEAPFYLITTLSYNIFPFLK